MKLIADLVSPMDEKAILDVLNGGHAFPGAKELEPYIARMHKEMLQHVDDWIDSGRKPDGSESPNRRNYEAAQGPWNDARSFLGHQAKLRLVPGNLRNCSYPKSGTRFGATHWTLARETVSSSQPFY